MDFAKKLLPKTTKERKNGPFRTSLRTNKQSQPGTSSSQKNSIIASSDSSTQNSSTSVSVSSSSSSISTAASNSVKPPANGTTATTTITSNPATPTSALTATKKDSSKVTPANPPRVTQPKPKQKPPVPIHRFKDFDSSNVAVVEESPKDIQVIPQASPTIAPLSPSLVPLHPCVTSSSIASSVTFLTTSEIPAHPPLSPNLSILTRRRRSIPSIGAQLPVLETLESNPSSSTESSSSPHSSATSVHDSTIEDERDKRTPTTPLLNQQTQPRNNETSHTLSKTFQHYETPDSVSNDTMTHHHLDRPLVPASSVLPSAEKRSGRKSGDRKPFQLPHYKPIHTQSNDSIFSREDSHHLDAFYIPGLIQPQLSQPNSPAPQSFAETSAVDSRSSKPYRTKSVGVGSPQKSQGLNQRSRSSSLGNHQPFFNPEIVSSSQSSVLTPTTSQSNNFQSPGSPNLQRLATVRARNKALEKRNQSSTRSEDKSDSNTKKIIRFSGFRNLAMIVMVVGNIRLVVENYLKYGIRDTFEKASGISDKDLRLAALITLSIPCHLFISLLIEKLASRIGLSTPVEPIMNEKTAEKSKKKKEDDTTYTKIAKKIIPIIPKPRLRHYWRLFATLHIINIVLCLAVTSYTVYYHIWNPAVGTVCQIHALVVCLKTASYALTNRDLRDATVINRRRELAIAMQQTASTSSSDSSDHYSDRSSFSIDSNEYPYVVVPDMYISQQYPKNLTISNLVYFWWAPTLVYQPVYPRTPVIRWRFVARQAAELATCIVFMVLLTGQYAVPILENSLSHVQDMNFILMLERLMKLATVSIVIWLLGFFALFQSFLNILAELTRFADRDFYQDWWNSGSLGTYWKLWNKPVSNYFRRHLYVPMLKRGWSQFVSSFVVFFVSAVLHEVLVGFPTHSIVGVAFLSMILQIPLVLVTQPLEKMRGPGTTIGNCVFWLSFFLGQPLGVLVYYFAFNVKNNPKAVMEAAATASKSTLPVF